MPDRSAAPGERRKRLLRIAIVQIDSSDAPVRQGRQFVPRRGDRRRDRTLAGHRPIALRAATGRGCTAPRSPTASAAIRRQPAIPGERPHRCGRPALPDRPAPETPPASADGVDRSAPPRAARRACSSRSDFSASADLPRRWKKPACRPGCSTPAPAVPRAAQGIGQRRSFQSNHHVATLDQLAARAGRPVDAQTSLLGQAVEQAGDRHLHSPRCGPAAASPGCTSTISGRTGGSLSPSVGQAARLSPSVGQAAPFPLDTSFFPTGGRLS